jgi:DNA-binding HxlR family transcriptional regulator
MLDRIGERWSLYVLCHLHDNGPSRFSEFTKAIPNISNRMLTLTLEKLSENNLIERQDGALSIYTLTDLGRSLMIPMRSLVDWIVVNARELDAGRKKFGLPPLDLPPGALD